MHINYNIIQGNVKRQQDHKKKVVTTLAGNYETAMIMVPHPLPGAPHQLSTKGLLRGRKPEEQPQGGAHAPDAARAVFDEITRTRTPSISDHERSTEGIATDPSILRNLTIQRSIRRLEYSRPLYTNSISQIYSRVESSQRPQLPSHLLPGGAAGATSNLHLGNVSPLGELHPLRNLQTPHFSPFLQQQLAIASRAASAHRINMFRSVDSQRIHHDQALRFQGSMLSSSSRATHPGGAGSVVVPVVATTNPMSTSTIPQHDAASMKTHEHEEQHPAALSSTDLSKTASRLYIDTIRETDVLCGRGGKSNHHPGNKRYRQVVSEMRASYRNIEAKLAKTDLSRAIIDHVYSYGGRFVKMDKPAGRLYVLSIAESRKKTSQALRETKELKWTSAK